MKKVLMTLSFGLFIATSFVSCKKDDAPAPPAKTKTELITAKTWMYDEYYVNYGQQNQELAYKRGGSNNTMDLSLARVKFNADGTVQETTELGGSNPGTWIFLNNETQTRVTSDAGIFTSLIVVLDETHYDWHGQDVHRYGKMIPAN